jgi:hypothetical protein
MTIAAATHPGTAPVYSSRSRGIRLDHVGLFVSGATLAVLEVSIRKELDLPLLETILALWGIAEFASRRLHLETARAPSLYILGGCCVLFGVWIVLADALNAQSWGAILRNLLKYEIMFVILAWLAHSPSKDRTAALLVGSTLGVAVVGATVLLANPDAPYLAKYQTPYLGVVLLAAWATGRPFDGGWRWILPAAAMMVGLLAVLASARWSIISGLVVCTVLMMPRISGMLFRIFLLLMALVPMTPVLLLDTETALSLIAEQDLRSAADVERVTLYAFAHDSIMRNPLFGIGFEGFLTSFEQQFGHILTMASAVQGPHNQYAAIGALFGVPALILYAAAVWASMSLLHPPARRPTRLAQAAAAMFGFAFLSNEVSDDARLAVYLVALILASGQSTPRPFLASLILPDTARRRGSV